MDIPTFSSFSPQFLEAVEVLSEVSEVADELDEFEEVEEELTLFARNMTITKQYFESLSFISEVVWDSFPVKLRAFCLKIDPDKQSLTVTREVINGQNSLRLSIITQKKLWAIFHETVGANSIKDYLNEFSISETFNRQTKEESILIKHKGFF